VAPPDDLPILPFAAADAFADWVAAQDGPDAGVWLKIAKKGTGIASVTYAEAVEVALCHGWIDGQRRGLDEQWFLQRFVPRRSRSIWSQVNVRAAEALIASGAMQPGGLREVERAKADGRWDAAYAPQSSSTVPDDLRAALDASPEAARFFATLSSQNRYAIVFRTTSAKRPETRARRIATFVAMLEAGETLHPQKPPPADGD
jgi:uncharacterized protein YdeI (YjbR/CyaY-like superfamily)